MACSLNGRTCSERIPSLCGDDLNSGNSEDCDPYQAGKSSIKRRYSIEHVFRQQGSWQVFFRLKQRDRVIAASSANVQVRPGVRDEFGN